MISFINSCCNFDLDFYCLAGVASVAGFRVDSVATSSSVAGSVGSHVAILSKFFIGNNLLLKILRKISLALNNNPKLYKKDFFSSVFVPFSKFFNSIAKLLCLR